MVSSEYNGTHAPVPASSFARLHARADQIIAALQSTATANCVLPADFQSLLDKLDRIPD